MNKYIHYSCKFDYFSELCRKGFLDTTNHFILDMYNVCIKYDAQLRMTNLDFKKLDELIDSFLLLDLNLYMSLKKGD